MVHAQSHAPTFVIGDIVANEITSGGCPTFDGLLSVLQAFSRTGRAHDVMTSNHCEPIQPRTPVRVVDMMMENTMRVEEPSPPGDDLLFVSETGFARVGGQPAPMSQNALPNLRQGTSYQIVRTDLLSKDYKIIDGKDTGSFFRCGSRSEICQAYPEANSCSDSGKAFCAFKWRMPNGQVFRIFTYGEKLSCLSIDNVGN